MFACCIGLALVPPALAVDGVIEINQARALAGGVTGGDTAGFPVTLSVSGSYRLTSNLDVSGQSTPENVTAIFVTADNVTIDLNGFSILGPVTCTPIPVTNCTPPLGTGIGINALSKDGLTVVNGSIVGMGSEGISAGLRGRIDRVRAVSNGGSGLTLNGRNALVTNCIVSNNRLQGINNGNGGESSISGNVVFGNGSTGISSGNRSTIANNTVLLNGQDGIGSFFSSALIGNTVAGNTGFGLSLGSVAGNRDGYVNNVITNNIGGTVSGGVQMGTNVCNGTTTCP